MSRPKTHGNGAPMPSLNVELPTYVVAKPRGNGIAFYFQVPKRLRPQGWPGSYRLPLAKERRSGRADAAELAAVVADGEMLYGRLAAERKGEPETKRLNTLPWLIQSFETHLKTTPRAGRRKTIAKATFRNYAYAARVVTEWSKEAGHPHVRLINRPAILKLLSTMNDKPTKRKHVAAYIRNLLFHAMDIGVRDDNPAIKLKIETPDAQVHIWTDEELDVMVKEADKQGLESVAIAMLIAHDEGPRPGDVLKFQRFRDYAPRDSAFRYFQNKTNGWVTSPAGKRVRERLAEQDDGQLMLIVNHRTKKRYNERVFNRDFDRVRTATGLNHLQFRHLRHTFVVKGKRAGLDEFEIAAKTGHSPKSVRDMLAKHYLPHDSEVAMNATAKIEAYRERKLDTGV